MASSFTAPIIGSHTSLDAIIGHFTSVVMAPGPGTRIGVYKTTAPLGAVLRAARLLLLWRRPLGLRGTAAAVPGQVPLASTPSGRHRMAEAVRHTGWRLAPTDVRSGMGV